jgi:hypothetical protein
MARGEDVESEERGGTLRGEVAIGMGRSAFPRRAWLFKQTLKLDPV